ncbi:MAG: DUF58 domain-containing protein [bacterium]
MSNDSRKNINYLDPSAIARLGNLSLAARTVVEGFISGLHQSSFKGFSLEFTQHRQYSPGDALKNIDWKVYGRSDRYVVKQYEEETNMRCFIVLDTSSSMGFKHGGKISKLAYASYRSASLAYLMLKQQDSVGLVTIDTHVRTIIPPRSIQAHLNNLLEVLEHVSVHQSETIQLSLTELGKRLNKRHVIVIISDLLGDAEELLKAIRYFHFRKHEVIVLQLLDPSERMLPYKGPVVFEGMENNELFNTEPETIKADYAHLMNSFLKQYYWGFRQSGIDYCLMETSQPFDIALGSYLTKRQMIR